MKGRQPFLVGQRTNKSTTVVVLRTPAKPLFRGPWSVRAVVRDRRPAPTRSS